MAEPGAAVQRAALPGQTAPRVAREVLRRESGGARDARIPRVEGFDHCLKSPAVLRHGVFVLHVRFVDAPVWRLGLVIPKRFERSAVARNAIKRRWREGFRRCRAAWASEFGGADLVVRMGAPLAPRTAVGPAPRGKRPGAPSKVVADRAKRPPTARQRAAFDTTRPLLTLAERLRSRAGERSPVQARGGG